MCSACTKVNSKRREEPPKVPAEFWHEQFMAEALAAGDMGRVMRAFRTHPFHGDDVPQAVAAQWVDITQSRLSRIENGDRLSDVDKLMRWAHVLGIPSDLLWFRMPNASAEPRVAPSVPEEGTVDHRSTHQPAAVEHGGLLLPVLIDGRQVLVPVDASALANSDLGPLLSELTTDGYPPGRLTSAPERDAMPLSRRSLLTRGITAAALPVLGLDEAQHVAKALDDARRYFDGSVVKYFENQLETCKTDDGSLGSMSTLPMVLGILGAIEQSVRDVRPAVRRELLSVASRGAEFAGWLYRDVHDQAKAGFWHDRATEWAQEAGDLPMQGYVLLKKAQMAYDDRDAVRVSSFAQAAQDGPWQLPAKVRAEVAQQEARGLAMLGEPMTEVERKLEDARRYFEQADDAAGQLGTHFNALSLTLQTASCYIEAGKPQRAAGLYDDVLGTGTLSRRDQGYFLARRASALALSGEPDDAAAVGLASIQLAAATSSARTRRELGRAVITLGPWSSRPGPRELRDALTST
jgi:hypothetical protein